MVEVNAGQVWPKTSCPGFVDFIEASLGLMHHSISEPSRRNCDERNISRGNLLISRIEWILCAREKLYFYG